jgi:hypothetical protein
MTDETWSVEHALAAREVFLATLTKGEDEAIAALHGYYHVVVVATKGECAKELDEIVLRLKVGTLPEEFAWILSQLAALADKWEGKK